VIVEKRESRATSPISSAIASAAITRPETVVASVAASAGVSAGVSAGASATASATASRRISRAESPTPLRVLKRPANPMSTDIQLVFSRLRLSRKDEEEKKAKEIFFHEEVDRDSIYGYLQQLRKKSTQSNTLSVGSYIDSASGEEREVVAGQ